MAQPLKKVLGRRADQAHGVEEKPQRLEVGSGEGDGPADAEDVAAGEHVESWAVRPAVGHADAHSQGVQEGEPSVGEKEPGAQSVQFAAPAAEKEPAGHVRHALADVLLVFALAVPASQSVGVSAPYGAYAPAGVIVHEAVEPSATVPPVKPSRHWLHDVDPATWHTEFVP